MSALGTLMATAAIAVGVVSGVKAVKRRFGAKIAKFRGEGEGEVIDMRTDRTTGVWRDPKSSSAAD